jgi:two-component system NtrC family sensor kinase
VLAWGATLAGALFTAAWLGGRGWWWAWLGGAAALAAAVLIAARAWGRELRAAEAARLEVAAQLDRRISELFSLQELGYILSGSLELERIVEQVVGFAARFLQTDGAVVVLSPDGGRTLRAAAAIGSLESLNGCDLDDDDDGDETILRGAIEDGRIRVTQVGAPPVRLANDVIVSSAAVAPLLSHGDRLGAIAVSDRKGGPFTTEDLWLLSTVATNASVVLANGRLFQMVQRSTEEWETAFNALTEGIAVVGPSGTVLRANSSLAHMAGVPEDDLVGRDFVAALFGPDGGVRQILKAARAGDRPAPLVARSELSHRIFRLTAAPLGDLAGRGSIVALVEDVTEQRTMEAQLIHSDKMATIGHLVSGVAHELNNPLTSIAGLTELLLERGPLPDFPREHLRVIQDQAERASRIVQNLLTFARKGTPDKAEVDLNDVIARTSLLIAYELKLRSIELHSRLSAEPLTVVGDRYELQQVLLNLITNAVQAVAKLPPSRARVITIETLSQGDQAVLRVDDSGDGVTPEHIAYLFTPFFTTKEPGQGTGLGLSLSYGIVESHGGRLAYEPCPTGGARFVLSLPRLSSREPLERGTRRILVVDDDPAVHRIVSALFAPDGHVVDAARSADDALRLASERSYDLVLADARAATEGGLFFADALLSTKPGWASRLVIASGNGRTEGGPAHQLSKPFNLRELRALADELFSTPPRSPAATGGS